MKIAILTLPLHTNYGGILQAYALQTILNRMGHDAELLKLQFYYRPLYRVWLSCFYSMLLKFIGKGIDRKVFKELRIVYKRRWIEKRINSFINKYIIFGEKSVVTEADFKLIANNSYDAFIVGSDQVWRKNYIKGVSLESFFLNFVPDNKLKLSYAASFGVDYSEYTKEDILKCGDAFSKLDYVSFRESSAMILVNEIFKWKSINRIKLVLDPTMLLTVSDYEKMFNLKRNHTNKYVYSYVFDKTGEVEKVEAYMSKKYTIIKTPSSDMIFDEFTNKKINQLYSPIEWLETIYNSQLVITDSFHCCVFSILFQIPFIIIPNSHRGNTRLENLLTMFCLNNRSFINFEWLIENEKELFSRNYYKVSDDILRQMRDDSFTLVKESLIKK